MKQQYHIVNGDALKAQFPRQILGEIIVARECFVDGDVTGSTLEELFSTRAKFISGHYAGCSQEDYYQKTVPEFVKMQNISPNSDIYLWFEDDLFCQVNFWFVINLLNQKQVDSALYLVRPSMGNEYSFGKMNERALHVAFQNKIKIQASDIQEFSKFWPFYQNNQCDNMLRVAKGLHDKYPFLVPAVKAYIDLAPKDGKLGRIEATLLAIMDECQSNDFPLIFHEFQKREPIYGLGDLQVRRIVEMLMLK